MTAPAPLTDRLALCLTGAVRALLSHEQWSHIAGDVQPTYNSCLGRAKKRAARWKKGGTPLSGHFGRELVILAWGIEEADPELVPVALRNWRGRLSEERWWLYSRVAAYPPARTFRGRGNGWRKALQFILAEQTGRDLTCTGALAPSRQLSPSLHPSQ